MVIVETEQVVGKGTERDKIMSEALGGIGNIEGKG